MTALVTALGLMPLALGSGEPGREIEGPMATIIVGGLATSTLLNLLVLPAILLHFGRFAPADESMPGLIFAAKTSHSVDIQPQHTQASGRRRRARSARSWQRSH